jgi:hypothetical protein
VLTVFVWTTDGGVMVVGALTVTVPLGATPGTQGTCANGAPEPTGSSKAKTRMAPPAVLTGLSVTDTVVDPPATSCATAAPEPALSAGSPPGLNEV